MRVTMSPLGCIPIPGGGVPPYISHIGCAAPKGMVFRPFGLKTGIYFFHFVWNQVGSRWNYGSLIYRFNCT